jgi:hypothetical protein
MTDMNLGTYSSDDLIVVLTVQDITHSASGFAEGTMVSVEKSTPSSTLILNGDAGGGRVFRKTSDGMITLTLNQWSSTNDVLSWIHKRDGETRDNTWLFNLVIKDGTGRSAHFARQCFIENLPNSSFGTDLETREWVIRSADMEHFVGGNSKLPASVISTIESIGGTVEDRWR